LWTFSSGNGYERPVGDVAGRIEGWAGDEGTRRLLEVGGEEVMWKVVLPVIAEGAWFEGGWGWIGEVVLEQRSKGGSHDTGTF